ncbi:MAG TPA: hypothetical protein DEQ40_17730, partial [Oxalobacteraceae bacterium]|nr:hypothetical protein [Oxalobacteraceae bacterium]
ETGSWLLNIYKSLSALNVQLSPEVRGVMDRMLASDEAIKGAEQTRGYKPLFETAPEGVTPEQWAAYQGLGKEATDQAVADMTSRSMKDMQWASNAKSRALKDLRRDASSKRKVIREEVTKEVDALPVYQAQEFIRANSGDVGHKKALADWRTDRDAQEATAKAETASKEERATRMAAWDDANPKPERARTPLDAWNDSRRAAEDAARETERARIGGGLKGLEKGQALAKNKRAIDNTVDRQMLDWESQNQKPGKFYAEVDKDIVAETHGFADKKDMQAAIDKAGPKKEMIEALTDQRMLEQHGELVDAQSIERAAEAAIHNEARAKFMATGLKILSKSPIPANQLAKAAKEAADAAIAAKRVMDLRPAQYSAAEAKANREAIKQAPKDPQAAVQAQRAALLNNRLFKAATDAVAEVKKTIDYVNKFNKDSIRAKIDVDIRDQIDDLMRRFDFRQTVPDGPTRKQMNLEKWIESQREAGYTPAFTADMIDPTVRMHYKEMSVEQLRGLRDTIAAMEHLGRERKSIIVNGQRVLVADLVHEQLVPKMQERGDNFTDSQLLDRPEDRHTNPIALALDKLGSRLRAIQAQLKPQEFKRNQYDNHELLGPFGAALFDRVFAANYHKVDMLKGLSDDFQAKATELGKDWQNSLNDQVANKRLMDPDRSKEGQPPVPMRISRGRMIGMALHVGNESNFDKLTKGWNWHPEDVWSFLHDNMGEKDWQAVKSVWDQYEKHFPEMQEMARRLGNTAPDKIEPRPFSTKFGELPGGYAAIKYDALRSRRGEKEAAGQAINPGDGLFNRNYFRADTTTNGSMNARVDGYTDRVDLDFHHIARTLHDSIHDLAYREALIDSNKLIGHPEFRTQFRKTYGPEAYLSLQDWVGRLANSENTDRAVGALGHFLSYTRTGIVMNGIALRASTVLKHGGSTGIKTTGYFLGGGEKYLASRFASMGTDYHGQIEGAKEKFPEIRARLLQQDRDYRAMSASLFEPESAQSKAERFGHAAVAWSDMMTAVPTAWAAYDRAITEGIPKNLGGTGVPMTEAQSVAYASKIVREAHGSNIESARSMALNTSSEALKMFTTLYGFMNNSYGQALDGFDKLRTAGISNPAILARSFMALIVPSLWAGYLVHGAPKDDEGWAAWIGKAIAGEVAGMVPFVRDVASMVEGYRSAGQVAAESWLSTMVKAGKDVKDLAQGNHVHAPIKDIANAAGMGLHIPGLGQIGTTAQYLADVHSGDQNPENAGQMVKDALLGPKR